MSGTEKLYDVWYVKTENAFQDNADRKVASGLTKEDAQEHIYFEHADEPSPDRSDYWNYVAVPAGTIPEKYQRRSKYD